MTLRISYVRAKCINISSITDNKKFWKTVKPPFSDKISHKETTNLVENYATLSYDQIIADTSSNYFNEIVRNLPTLIKKLPLRGKLLINCFNVIPLDPIEAAVSNYKNHPSLNAVIKSIKFQNQIIQFSVLNVHS